MTTTTVAGMAGGVMTMTTITVVVGMAASAITAMVVPLVPAGCRGGVRGLPSKRTQTAIS